ncbi:MAG: hypothetical protein LBC79_04950 [Deltaproteobacteria bacterium]|jgi:hypothetical protein|nr:hypothetical protein [Deltaproteobacteria bacterium]
MSTAFQEAVRRILEVVMFENWLRFYFLTEPEGGGLALAVPEQGLARIREQHPHFIPLVEELNGREISFELSRRAVCTFVAAQLDGKAMPVNTADSVLDSAGFQLEVHLFNSWVQGHEEQLDRNFVDFSSWARLFEQWRNSGKVKAWAAGLAAAGLAEADTTAQ